VIVSLDNIFNDIISKRIISERGVADVSYADIASYFDYLTEHGWDKGAADKLSQKLYKEANKQLYQKIKKYSSVGKNVIVDTLMFTSEEVGYCRLALKGFPALYVLVYCPPEKLMERVLKRNQSKKEYEYRDLLTPFSQFFDLYGQQAVSGNAIDVLKLDAIESALDLVREMVTPIASVTEFNEHREKVLKNIGFTQDKKEVALIPASYSYDICVNTGENDDYDCARLIKNVVDRMLLAPLTVCD
jgi:chloramphenicol 3-O-phosphotransferase